MRTPPDRIDVEELVALMRASRVITTAIARSVALTGSGLTLTQVRVLLQVARNPGTSVADIALSTHTHRSSASRFLERLALGGYVTVTRLDEDRRKTVIALTPAGERIVERYRQLRSDAFTALLGELDGPDRACLHRGLTALADAAHEPHSPFEEEFLQAEMDDEQ